MVISGDNPIEQPSDDLIGRTSVAAVIADELRNIDASEGCVVAIMGPWGSGKTSLVNLVQVELARDPAIPVLNFNPWMFSGAEQLVNSFFRELAAQLHLKKGRLDQIASEVEAYGDLLSPVADIATILSALPFGGWMGRARNAAGAVKQFQERRKSSVTEERKKLSGKLKELERPIVVVADDIDRLTTAEIRDMFKLVRLTASFPNVIYLVAFDRKRVEDALAEGGIDGRSYLEKIVQVSFDIPVLPLGVLSNQLARALSDVLEEFDGQLRFNEGIWTDVMLEIVLPMIRNMRDVRRYCASARGTVRAIKSDIELVDLLALEAIRVFLPDVFALLADAREALTGTGLRSGSPELKARIDRLLEIAGDKRDIVTALINRLFPAAQSYISNRHYGSEFAGAWLAARRVAHIEILALYLERTAGEPLIAFTDAERAFAMLDDERALDSFLRSIELGRLEGVISGLENYEGSYPVNGIPVALTVLLNLLPILPERPRGLLEPDTKIIVTRVVLRLFRQLPGPEVVEQVVRKIKPKVSTLSSRLHLILVVGHQENAGHKLISAPAAEAIEGELVTSVRSADPSTLAQEWDLFILAHWVQQRLADGERALPVLDNLALNAKVLIGALTEVRSQAYDSRTVTRSQRLHWDMLTELYGDEQTLRQVVDALEDSQPTDEQLVKTINLAKRYLGGWRPKPFSDEE